MLRNLLICLFLFLPLAVNAQINNHKARIPLEQGIEQFQKDYKVNNFEASKKLFRISAENGSAFAASWLAIIDMEENPGPLSLDRVHSFADNGEIYAQFYLGVNYAYGKKGVAKDRVTAAYWFERAARQGSYHAAGYLVWICYSMDEESLNDLERGLRWYYFDFNEADSHWYKMYRHVDPLIIKVLELYPLEMGPFYIEGGISKSRYSPIKAQIKNRETLKKDTNDFINKTIQPENLRFYEMFSASK